MQVQLNETELEVAVTLYLNSQGMNLKGKKLDFSFEGECTMDIETDSDMPVAKPKATRKKATPKAVEEKKEEVKVEEVVEELEKQAAPESEDKEDLFASTSVKEQDTSNNEKSIFG